jgi:predicted dinucleotide-binding enzyme
MSKAVDAPKPAVRILVIGAGAVGVALGNGWIARGHDVRYGVRDVTDPKYADLPQERLVSSASAGDAEVVVLATPWAAAHGIVESLGPQLNGKVLIDCTNPLTRTAEGLGLLFGHDTSGAEQIAQWAPGALVFKTLNQTGAENLIHAGGFRPRPVMFVAGDDSDAKQLVMALVRDLGLSGVDAGPLSAARLLEPLAMLWIELAMKRGHGREFAFSLVGRARA